jgi:hypothetical protein
MTTIEISGGLPLSVLQQINNDLSSIEHFTYQKNCNHNFESDTCLHCGLEVISW